MKNQFGGVVALGFSSLLMISVMAACQTHPPVASQAKPVNAAEANLTQVEAAARSKQIEDVQYKLNITLGDKSDKFTGTSLVTFTLKAPASGLFLDFKDGGEVTSIDVNGTAVAPMAFARHRIALPDAALKVGENKVAIQYSQTYANDGRGLHRFADPEDHRVYLYTQFEEFDAHQMFPCFDQPDLKATMTMNVIAPNGWEVISTTRESSSQPKGEKVEWKFPTSPKISTYLFSLHAGPYAKWTGGNAGPIPMRLFARRSLARYVHPADWFSPTKEGLAFYGNYFGYPYPFKKYDEIVAPDFNAGAMENVAAITFTERFIHRGAETRDDRERLASVILHEMAHMWFGDLVTMKWWNGLWLNESFATYMSALSQSRATEYKNSWLSFYTHEKVWAYTEDQLVSTHPVDGEVVDTDSAGANFDGITYGKGAAVLKQLSAYLGEDHFRDGLRTYFAEHAYGNTTLQDFIAALGGSSKQDLTPWAQAWLSQPGLDSVRARFLCDQGSIANFSILLRGPDGGVSPRTHKTRLQLYKAVGDRVQPTKAVDLTYSDAETQVPSLIGQPCPDLVDTNAADEDYAKMQLDGQSLATARKDIAGIDSAFVRLRLWGSLYQMVRDHQLLPQDYLTMVNDNLIREPELKVGEAVMRTLHRAIYYLPDSNDQEHQAKLSVVEKLQNTLWSKAQHSPAGSDWQKEAVDGFVDVVQTPSGIGRCVSLLQNKSDLSGLQLDQDRRWEIITLLMSFGDARGAQLLTDEKKKDGSERGQQMAMAAEASAPSMPVKQAWIDKTMQDAQMSFSRKRTILSNFMPEWQDSLRTEFASKYYEMLPKMAKNRDEGYLKLFASALMPSTCTENSAKTLASFTANHRETLPMPIVKRLRQGEQEDQRCTVIRRDAADGKASGTPEVW